MKVTSVSSEIIRSSSLRSIILELVINSYKIVESFKVELKIWGKTEFN